MKLKKNIVLKKMVGLFHKVHYIVTYRGLMSYMTLPESTKKGPCKACNGLGLVFAKYRKGQLAGINVVFRCFCAEGLFQHKELTIWGRRFLTEFKPEYEKEEVCSLPKKIET